MRKFASVAVILMITAIPLAIAGQTAAKAKSTTHEMPAELVSMDLKKQTVTLKSRDGQETTVPVTGEAVATLTNKQVKPGDKVIATCEDDEQGQCKAVTKIKAATT